ncbi:MAG: DoxX family protein [Bryobacteraceae bacterium]|nr:DoxX family protein [Bryobacteraceae bacterium]
MKPVASPAATSTPSRGLNVVLWIVQVVCAAMFVFASVPKLTSDPAAIQGFELLGLGQWFRYLTGTLEALGGIALLIPPAAPFGALVLVCVMVGAILSHLLVLPGSPLPAPVFLLLCLFIAWGRRARLQALFSRR